MKKIILISLLAMVSLLTYAQDKKSQFKKYPFKSVIIEYKIEGKTNGTKTVYIDDYGYKEATYRKTLTKMFGMKDEEDVIEIMVGSAFYAIDNKTGEASSTMSPMAQLLNATDENWEQNNENLLEQLGFEKIGNENLNGKDCEVWKGMNKVWIWKGLLLKSETKMLGMNFTETFTDIKINASIPSVKFEVPDNIELEENEMGGEMQELMKGFQEEMKNDKKNLKLPTYKQFKASMLEDDPDMKEEDIKMAYELAKKFMK